MFWQTGHILTNCRMKFHCEGVAGNEGSKTSGFATPLSAIGFYHRCTIANPVLQAQNKRKRGTIPSEWCLILNEALTSRTLRLNGSLVGGPREWLLSLLRKAQGVSRVWSAKTFGACRPERR